MKEQTKYVYFFGAGQTEGNANMRNLLGGKGANLAEMTALGNALAEAGAEIAVISMTTPYCLNAVSAKAWKAAVYQYDGMGVDALTHLLARA